jgi:hypothetical protein
LRRLERVFHAPQFEPVAAQLRAFLVQVRSRRLTGLRRKTSGRNEGKTQCERDAAACRFR